MADTLLTAPRPCCICREKFMEHSLEISRRLFAGSLLSLGFAPPVRAALPEGVDWPNVFISPAGRPYRAPMGAPYPVIEWFKKTDTTGDGKIDRAEFVAEAEAFFKVLDQNGDDVLGPQEVAFYEQRIAPEVLGGRVDLGFHPAGRGRNPLLWLAQVARPGPIDPAGDGPDTSAPPHLQHHLDESGQGAAPYSFFDEPEPLMAADLRFRGLIAKQDFLTLADAHFTTLDRAEQGFLTLAGLPKTPVQKKLERSTRPRTKG